jgi:DNA replication and repair protein RecF
MLLRHGADRLRVFAELESKEGPGRIGLERSGRDWQARIDGAAVPALADLFRRCPVVCFEPGSHALIGGPAEHRRRFLDWGLFHVEPAFLPVWREYQRALRQRNALLRTGQGGHELDPWDAALARHGEALDGLRRRYLESLLPRLQAVSAEVFPGPGEPVLRYSAGWDRQQSLMDALLAARERDRSQAFTSVGPHRANWAVAFPRLARRDELSRGQEKLTALCCLLAQASDFASIRGEWPLLCLDDLASELDREHQTRSLAWLAARPLQAWISGTDAPAGLEPHAHALFHVEHACVRRETGEGGRGLL